MGSRLPSHNFQTDRGALDLLPLLPLFCEWLPGPSDFCSRSGSSCLSMHGAVLWYHLLHSHSGDIPAQPCPVSVFLFYLYREYQWHQSSGWNSDFSQWSAFYSWKLHLLQDRLLRSSAAFPESVRQLWKYQRGRHPASLPLWFHW